MSINERLRQVIEAKGMTVKSFAEAVGIPLRSVHNYLSGEREPSADVLIKIAQAMSVNLNWLLLNQDEMFFGGSQNQTLNADEIALLERYRETTKSGKNILLSTSKTILDELR